MDYRYGSHTGYQIEYHFEWGSNCHYKVLIRKVAVRVPGAPFRAEHDRQLQDGAGMKTRRSGDAYPDFQSVTHQPTGFSRWSLSPLAMNCRF